jgi:hypothetical protein
MMMTTTAPAVALTMTMSGNKLLHKTNQKKLKTINTYIFIALRNLLTSVP